VSGESTPLRVTPQALIAGVVRALQEQVLPQVASRTARGQLWAAIDVLRNLSARIEPARAPFEEEVRSAEGALRGLAAQSPEPLAAEIAARLDALPVDAAARVEALRALLRDVFERLDALAPDRGAALRALLGGHLAAQVIRDLSRFQGSLLDEISKG
jgi:hypothetical protein